MRRIVSAPDLRPAKNGLLNVANVVEGESRWEDGVTFTPHGCQAIYGHVPDCGTVGDKSDFFDCVGPVEADAWLLELGLVWSMADMGADPKAMITEAMEIGTSSVLERLAWDGVSAVAAGTPIPVVPLSGNPTAQITGRVLGTPPPTLVGDAIALAGVATNVQQAIGLLEAKFLDASDHIGGSGTIWMSPVTVVQAGKAIDYVDGGKLVARATGSPVIVANVPADMIIGHIGEADVYLGEVFIVEAQERANNEWVGRAERRATVVWNPCGVWSVDIP